MGSGQNNAEEDRCPRCGAAISAGEDPSLCPACMMSIAVEPTLSETPTELGAPSGAGLLGGLAEFPCEFGGYRLLSLLGRGGMGTVYEAEELATGRRVALKMLAEQLDSPEMRKRFLREGRLAAGVNHPNSLYASAVDKVAASIKEFGWQQPIVVDSEIVIIAGHTRLLAAQKLGMTQVPVVIANELTNAQVKAYRLADNRVASETTFDHELLGITGNDRYLVAITDNLLAKIIHSALLRTNSLLYVLR